MRSRQRVREAQRGLPYVVFVVWGCSRSPRAAAEVVVQAGASAAVTDVAWSPDGALVASVAYDRSVQIVDADSMAVRARREDGAGWGVGSAAWSPDGRRLAIGFEGSRVRVLDVATGRFGRRVGPKDPAAFAWRLRSLAVASKDGRLRTFDAEWLRPAVEAGDVAAWSPDGTRIAWATRGWSAALLDARTGERRGSVPGAEGGITAIAWSPDGDTIAIGSGAGVVQAWDVGRRGIRFSRRAHAERVRRVAWSPDGRTLASASDDGTVILWKNGDRVRRTIRVGGGAVYAAAWRPDGQALATGGEDGALRVFDARSGVERGALERSGDVLRTAAWRPGAREIAFAGEDGRVRVLDVRDGKARALDSGATDVVWRLAWSPDGTTLAAACEDATIRLWSDGATKVLRGHSDAVHSVAWSVDGRLLASAGRDGVVVVWDAVTGRGEKSLGGENGEATAVAWSADTLFAGFEDGTILSWSADGFEAQAPLRGHSKVVSGLAVTPDFRTLVSASWDGTVRVWHFVRPPTVLAGPAGGVTAIALRSDGRMLAAAGGGAEIRTWEMPTLAPMDRFVGPERGITSLAWGPDARTLVVTGYGPELRFARANAEPLFVRVLPADPILVESHGEWDGDPALVLRREAGDLRTARLTRTRARSGLLRAFFQ